jgi:rhomboid protease GluP
VSDAPEPPLRITPAMLLSRRVDFERRMRRFPPVTLVLVAVLALVFVLEDAVGALDGRDAIVAAGALERAAVASGEYWRLLTAPFLHGGLDHLVSNVIALFILGMVCEHAFGRSQFVILYLGSALGGSVLSLALSPGPSVGASGAIFGLQGAAIVLFRRHRDRLLVRDRRIGFVLLAWALYAIVGGFFTPYIDNGAHLGGAVTGALVARGLHPVVLEPLPPERWPVIRNTLAVYAVLVAYAGVAWLLN